MMTLSRSALGMVVLLGMVTASRGEDWPCYNKDARRSAATAEQLAFPLATSWVHRAALPQPAWPEPGRTVNMLDFDIANQPVVAGGLLYYGSSADDSVHAVSAVDGKRVWTFTAGAPVRFAPHISGGKCYFASDDGVVYCLDAATGALVWQHRPFTPNRMISGNGRMISRWPCRSGILVIGDKVYGTAGMWPSEGTCFFALDARTGKPVWFNDTVNADYQLFPHDGISYGGPTPQGYLLSDGEILVVPTGQSAPAGFDIKTGDLLSWPARASGSTWASMGDGFVMVPARAWQVDQEIRLGEADLWESDGIAFYDLRAGKRSAGTKWSSYSSIPGTARFGKGRLRGMIDPIAGRDRAILAGNVLYSSGMDVIEAVDASQDKLKLAWRVPAPRIYSLALAGGTLLAGADSQILALRATDGKTVWSARVDGQVRGLAVADGKLFASTDRGQIYGFGGKPGSSTVAAPETAVTPAGKMPAGLTVDPRQKGFAFVCGAADTALGEALADASELNVICLLSDTNAVAAARKRLLGRGYGTRVVVHEAPKSGALPYADFCANVIIALGDLGGAQVGDLYRMLAPCTGKMYFPGAATPALSASLQTAAIPIKELVATPGMPCVARGPIPGAFDWNSTAKADQTIKWPLELLWFGGPGRDRMLRRHGRYYPPPVPAHGRVYLEGESHVMGVDAYNGTELWSWYVPGFRSIYADDKNVYVAARNVIQYDAQNGRITKVYGNPKPFVFDLQQPRSFDAKKGNKYSGNITVSKSGKSLDIQLVTKTPTPYSSDCWMLYFDLRTAGDRLSPEAAGTFNVMINTRNATFRRCTQPAGVIPPRMSLMHGPEDSETIMLSIPLDELNRAAGRTVDSFDLRAEIQLYEFGNEAPRRWLRDMPLTGGQDLLQNGTATFVLTPGKAEPSPIAALPKADIKEVPAGANDWGRIPFLVRHDGNIPRPPVATEINTNLGSRITLFGNKKNEQVYQRGYGCSGTISSSFMDFFRSGTLGMYDLSDDSGMRNFPGMKPGCGVSLLPALGLLISGEANADCFCPYSFSTSLALAPAAQRKNEDWALFFDKPDNAALRHSALNLGAPGDRRDENSVLWIGYPRTPLMEEAAGPEQKPHTMGLPLAMATYDGARRVRVNADRTVIENTKQPWIFASQMLGLKSLTLGLVYYDPKKECLAFPAGGPITVDARLDEPTWNDDTGVPVASEESLSPASLRVRSDAENLYFAYKEPASKSPWKAGVATDQGNIWADNHISIVLKDRRMPLCAQFGVAAGGAHYSADMSYRMRVPKLNSVTVDGKAADWGNTGLVLPLAEKRGTIRIAWTPQGLATLTVLPKDFFSAQKEWNALRTQIIGASTTNVLETVAQAGATTAEALRPLFPLKDDRSGVDADSWEKLRKADKVTMPLVVTTQGDETVVEALFPWAALGIKPVPGARCALKLVVFNPKAEDQNISFGGGARRDILRGEMLPVLELSAGTDASIVKPDGIKREFYGSILQFAMAAQPVATKQWTAVVAADQDSFRSEIAIPIKLLSSLGLSLDRMDISVQPAGKLTASYASLSTAMNRPYRLNMAPAVNKQATYTVKMMFAELDDVKPGERVFSVRIQGRTVEEALDVVKEAGGVKKALTRTYTGVQAGKIMNFELVPKTATTNSRTMPFLSGLEIVADQK